MTTIHDVLAELRSSATDERDKGDKFEHLIAGYLRTDPLYERKFSQVWLWSDWPGRAGRPDVGIDLVAEDRETGELCAIQCKFYDESHTLQKSDIDSFFTASGKEGFTSRMVVSTTDKWSKHAEEALEGQQIPVFRLRVQDLDDSGVDWSQFSLARPDRMRRRNRKVMRPHQTIALNKVTDGFAGHDRGKLIMACGTGKTFTSLKIAEHLVPAGGSVLFCVPSISLMSQTLKEWSAEADVPLRPFAVCSDIKVGKPTASEDVGTYDLAYPASTDADKLYARVSAPHSSDAITVIFTTYQSIDVVAKAQKTGLASFDLIICDEAHRTTGVTLAGDDESSFVKVHDPAFLQAGKRLYMTATPRIYDDGSKSQAQDNDAIVCSMDDETVFGPELHRLSFGEAVGAGLLTDYKVLVLAVDEKYVSKTFQRQLADQDNALTLDDAAKIVGCWNGLSKRGLTQAAFEQDPAPMRRAVAFARSIEASKRITDLFTEIIADHVSADFGDDGLRCEIEHVDGTFNVLRRNEKLDWLKAQTGDDGLCRILSNARCLSEGVDVPALDAVIFLNPRNSVVDVVQSVGRVMRRAEGKRYGYVILPIGVPADQSPEEALRDNQKYKVVWQVLQALRAHDDQFNAMVNKIELNKAKDDKLQIIGIGAGDDNEDGTSQPAFTQTAMSFPQIDEWRDALYVKIVQKVGDRRYWEDWAKQVATIAERHTTRIKALLESSDRTIREAFDRFLAGLHQNINTSITEVDAIEMLSQHLITKPVFEALFQGYSFGQHNPVSQSMQGMIDILEGQALAKETQALDKFYDSVRSRAAGIDNAEGKQKIIIELYEKFFRTAFPRTAERLGIVYTPVEVVDFIIHTAEAALSQEFGASLSDAGVHVLDPFTGTGTFMVRLLQSGLIDSGDLAYKYENELHANEIILLSYYIAAINIEATFHDLAGGNYRPFEGIVLTDTFQMTEDGGFDDLTVFPENNERVARQKAQDIRVIVGNPPYNVGQDSANDANQNLRYPVLDEAIRSSYAAHSTAQNKSKLYDSYIRAFRWASDRIKDKGVVCFVSNGAFLDANSTSGLRKSLADEFTSVYCFNLRGNQRTQGDVSRKEGGKIFDAGSRTTVAITLLVKNPDKAGTCEIYYYDIGDYLSREQKLAKVRELGNAYCVPWEQITPNANHDWINQRDQTFGTFTMMGSKDKAEEGLPRVFTTYSNGLNTARDAWVYNSSQHAVLSNVTRMLTAYNEQVDIYASIQKTLPKSDWPRPEDFVTTDPTRVKWARGLLAELSKLRKHSVEPQAIRRSLYRPFTKKWCYFDKALNDQQYLLARLFPTPAHPNLVIMVPGAGKVASKGFSVFVSDCIPSLGAATTLQCFPLYYYEKSDDDTAAGTLFGSGPASPDGYRRKNAITDEALKSYREAYGPKIQHDDVFYYVYGLLHSPEYVSNYLADLQKMLPRIPMVKTFADFCTAGRQLAQLHLAYDTVDPYPLDIKVAEGACEDRELFRLTKMRFGARGDRSTIIYNSFVTISGIPAEAYDYIIQGRNAIDWLMTEYQVTTDPDSGIVNDPNLWSDDPRYILDLIGRVVRVAVETRKIISGLPSLEVIDA